MPSMTTYLTLLKSQNIKVLFLNFLQHRKRRQTSSWRFATSPDDVSERWRQDASRVLDRRRKSEAPRPAQPGHTMEKNGFKQRMLDLAVAEKCKKIIFAKVLG